MMGIDLEDKSKVVSFVLLVPAKVQTTKLSKLRPSFSISNSKTLIFSKNSPFARILNFFVISHENISGASVKVNRY